MILDERRRKKEIINQDITAYFGAIQQFILLVGKSAKSLKIADSIKCLRLCSQVVDVVEAQIKKAINEL